MTSKMGMKNISIQMPSTVSLSRKLDQSKYKIRKSVTTIDQYNILTCDFNNFWRKGKYASMENKYLYQIQWCHMSQ